LALGLHGGCIDAEDAAKRELRERVWQAEARWYRAAWGEAPPDEERARMHRRFDCVWNGLRAREVDPQPDLECLARSFAAVGDCQASGKPVAECTTAFVTTCTHSAAFEELAATCKT
jgi:hypothetical protein